MNVCVAHLQMNACVAKNFGAWTEKVGHPCIKLTTQNKVDYGMMNCSQAREISLQNRKRTLTETMITSQRQIKH